MLIIYIVMINNIPKTELRRPDSKIPKIENKANNKNRHIIIVPIRKIKIVK